MADKTPEELHNELMDYPCKFTIKAMGHAHIDLSVVVINIVKRHAKDAEHTPPQSKFSKSKKYISISLTITAQSKQQMDAIYQDLSDSEHVLMSL
ncbi:MAG: DUF493 domain-containing protein [Cycloclasticus sp.]